MARTGSFRIGARAVHIGDAWAFLRIATNPRVFEHPLTVAEALDAVTSWLAQPVAAVIDPGERHWDLLREVASQGQATGPMVMDAVLAAVAIERGATLYTTDRDFGRFPGLVWKNPLTVPEDTTHLDILFTDAVAPTPPASSSVSECCRPTLWRVPGDGGKAVPLTVAVRNRLEAFALSPDDRTLALSIATGGEVELWALDVSGLVRQPR